MWLRCLLVRPVAWLVALLAACIATPIANAVPLAPDPTGSVHAVHVYTASDPSPDHRSSRVGDCVDGKPTVTIFFSAKGTGQVRVTAQRTTSTVKVNPADVYWSQLIEYPKENEVVPVVGIAAPLDDSEFHVFVTPGPKDTSGPGHVVLSVSHVTCQMPTPPEALKAPPAPAQEGIIQQVTDWGTHYRTAIACGLVAILFLACAGLILLPDDKSSS
jgi:hypothetical protein